MHPRDRLDAILRRDYGKSVIDVAKGLGYSLQNLEFLTIDLADDTSCASLMRKHEQLIDSMKLSTSYKNRMDRGKRLPVAMFANLVQGWITEDLTVLMLREAGFHVELSGVDKDRNIYNVNVLCEPDILIRHGDRKQWIELATEYTNYGMDGEKPFFELRKTKFLRCHEHKAYVLYRNLAVGKYILVDLSRGKTILHKVPKKEWNVYSMRYYFEENHREMRTFDKMVDELKALLNNVGDTEQSQLEVIDEMPKTKIEKHERLPMKESAPSSTYAVKNTEMSSKETVHAGIQKKTERHENPSLVDDDFF